MMVPPTLISRLRRCQSLPSPPNIVLSLLELTEDATAPARKFSNLIEKDPALSAQVLRIVNSPIYSLRREITSLQHAVAHVGIYGIRILALGFALSRGLFSTAPRDECVNHVRKRSVLASVTARELAAMLAAKHREEVFLGALMQDLGIFALLEVMGESYGSLLRSAEGDHSGFVREENRLLNTDHAEVGAWLLGQWGLPEVLQQMVACSHQLDGHKGDLVHRCVAVSGLLAEVWLLPGQAENMREDTAKAADLLGVDRSLINQAMGRAARKIPEIFQLFNLDEGADDYESTVLQAQQAAFSVGLHGMAQMRKREEILEALSGQIDQLKIESRTDCLTGAFNRLFLEEAIEVCFQEAVAECLPLGLCYCDLDNFKIVNDRLGHATGDLVLKTVAQALKEALRQGDFVGRYGGDEFLVMLRGCAAGMMEPVCLRLQETVSKRLQGLQLDSGIPCSISIGFAVQAGSQPYSTSSQWIKAADEALYQAKRQGKNKAVGHQLNPQQPGRSISRNQHS